MYSMHLPFILCIHSQCTKPTFVYVTNMCRPGITAAVDKMLSGDCVVCVLYDYKYM